MRFSDRLFGSWRDVSYRPISFGERLPVSLDGRRPVHGEQAIRNPGIRDPFEMRRAIRPRGGVVEVEPTAEQLAEVEANETEAA